MPCMDYNTSTYSQSGSRETQDKLDMLSRIACRSLALLEKIQSVSLNDTKNTFNYGMAVDDLLRDPEIAEWWPTHKLAEAKEQARLIALNELMLKKSAQCADALAKLADTDKKAPGL